MIRIEFQNTFDDYREANGIPVQPKRSTLAYGIRMIVLFAIAGAAIVFALAERENRASATDGGPFPWGRLALVLAPSAIVCAIFAWALFRQVGRVAEPWKPPPDSKRPGAIRTSGIAGWALFLGLTAGLFFLLNQRRPARMVRPGGPGAPSTQPVQRLPSYFDHVLPLTGWACIIAQVAIFSRLQRSRLVPKAWNALPNEQTPRTLDATVTGVVIEHSLARLEYRWGSFAGYREMDNLIMLYLSPYVFLMIPKRAFAEPGQLAVFKGLVMNGIPNGYFLPADSTSFPVLPPPIPVLPIPEEPAGDEAR